MQFTKYKYQLLDYNSTLKFGVNDGLGSTAGSKIN
jgi:hypothetical protein